MKGLLHYLGIGISLSLFVMGCSSSPIDESSIKTNRLDQNDLFQQNRFTTDPQDLDLEDILDMVERISVITPEGTEIDLQIGPWFNELKHQFSDLVPASQELSEHQYTIVLWFENGNPYILQIGDEGIRIGNKTYIPRNMEAIIKGFRQEVGQQLLKNLTIDQISLFSMDVANLPLELKQEEMVRLIEEISNARYLENKPDIRYPLFPHYVIQLISGKSYINLDVIGNNLIALPYGDHEYIYYKVEDDLFQRLYSLIPPFDFTAENPKSLFNATAIEIKQEGKDEAIQIGTLGMQSLQADSITDSFARLFIRGKSSDVKPEGEILTHLTFIGQDGAKEVQVFANGFIHHNRFFALEGIGREVNDHIIQLLK